MPKKEQKLKKKYTTELSVKVISAKIKEPIPQPNQIFDNYKIDRKKSKKSKK